MGGKMGKRRWSMVAFAPFALCILATVLLLAHMGVGPLPGTSTSGAVEGGSGGEDSVEPRETADAGESAGSPAEGELYGEDVVREALDAEAAQSSSDSFLSDLSGAREQVVAVEWADEEGLVSAGEEVLGAYGEAGASLMMDGYLDLHGTAWAAVVQGDAWVDVVAITGPHEGGASVRVVRIAAES